jgi:hypothetical protein
VIVGKEGLGGDVVIVVGGLLCSVECGEWPVCTCGFREYTLKIGWRCMLGS